MRKTITLFSSFLITALIVASCSTTKTASITPQENAASAHATHKVVYGPKGRIVKNDIATTEAEKPITLEQEDAPAIASSDVEVVENQNKRVLNQTVKNTARNTSSAHRMAKSVAQVESNNKERFEEDSKTRILEDEKGQDSSDDTLLYVLLTILIPFGCVVAMYLYEGNNWTSRVTLNLILTLLCLLPGVIHALVVILGKK